MRMNVSGWNDNQAAFIAFTATNTGTGGIALGGYTSTTGAKGSTRNVYGLQYGNWWGFNVGAVGDVYLNHFGADVAGSISYASGAGGFTTLNSIGIRANGYSNSMGGSACEYATSTNAIGGKFSAIDGNAGNNNITITNAYGVYLYSVANDADHVITNDYGLYVEAPANTYSTNRYQVVLAGSGTGTGIWLNGTSGNRLYSDGTDFFVTGMTSVGTTGPDLNYVSATGKIEYESSTRRIKEDIEPYYIDGSKFLGVTPKAWKYIESGNPDTGFVVEDLVEAGMGDAVGYNENGEPQFLRKYMLNNAQNVQLQCPPILFCR